jgi:hypothetical protein
MGCIVAQLSPTQTENLSQAGFHFGMAFQWDDDLQDWKQDHPHTPHCDADRLHTQGMRNAARKQAFAYLEEAGLNADALDALYRQDTAEK